ncbi:unnamed protein product [Staurois parvus]|uniref:Secreted protein n=1 Tax=Staurois parvus TaxID=386267 RepID=A0ABN9GTA3_9NEOB|nr:unnamed protein product [Staurois parvus]
MPETGPFLVSLYLASFSRCFIYPYAGMLGMPCFIAPYRKLASYLFLSATRTIAEAWKSPFVPFQGCGIV